MKDQISALVDNEVLLHDAEYLYTALKSGGESRQCWATYHLIGDAMRESPVFSMDLYERIMRGVDAEPVLLAPARGGAATLKKEGWIAPRWSVAASLAAVAFVGYMVLQQPVSEQQQLAAESQPLEIAQNLPDEYLRAHQSVAPSSAAYYIQPAAFAESAQ